MPGLASIKGTRIEELKTKERLPEGPVKEEKKPTKFTNIREVINLQNGEARGQ